MELELYKAKMRESIEKNEVEKEERKKTKRVN